METIRTTKKSEKPDVGFLLKEYEELWAQARHVDEYMERVPRFFLVVVGATAATITALIRFSTPSSSSFFIGGIVLSVLALIGFFASLTIPRYRVIRLGYFNATYLIRKYFVDKREELRKYMWFPAGGTFEGYRHVLRIDFFRFMMMAIMDSSLMFAGLYAVRNSQVLVNLNGLMPPLGWVLPAGVSFFAMHLGFYFYIIKFYEDKDKAREESKRLESGCTDARA